MQSQTKILLKIKHIKILLMIAAVVYPGWTIIHNLVFHGVDDSYLERLIVSAYFFVTIFITFTFKNKLSPERQLLILQTGRWVMTTHFFMVVARNQLSVQYALTAYFITFTVSLLFEKPKYFLLYSAYVLFLSLFIKSGYEYLPAYLFQLGLATCLGISYISISNKHKLLETIEESEKVFRSVFENSGIGIALIHTNGDILKANEYFNQLIGYDPQKNQSHKKTSVNLIFKENHQVYNDLRLQTKTQCEVQFINLKSEQIWAKVSLTKIANNDHNSFSILLTENITLHKKAEAQIIEQQHKLNYSAKMTALGEMASGIAHEINNPLGTINATSTAISNLLKKKNFDDPFVFKSLEKINTTVDRIAKIIKGLRNFSREASQDELQLTHISEILQDTLSLCSESLKKNQIDIKVNHPYPDSAIFCRPAEISQVLLNLLSNATAVLSQHNGERIIEILTTRSEELITIEVSNTGPLIAEEIKNKIFQPFFTTKPVGEGTGLGLSISTGIMKSHQGSLELKKNCPRTTFVLTFPRKLSSNLNEAV